MQTHSAIIGFIGGGNMAQAIIRGLMSAGHDPARIQIADPQAGQRDAAQALSPHLSVTHDNAQLAASSDVLVLAVKPQIMRKVVEPLARIERPPQQLVLSVAAGITTSLLREWLGDKAMLVRAMPNTPALVGAGMSGLFAADTVTPAARKLAAYTMEATGQVLWFNKEDMLDGVTAVSGSGPAYFFLIMEIMQEVAEELGFDSADARLLVTQTTLGAGLLAADSTDSLRQLRERVTSPGGTTAAALDTLVDGGIHDIVRSALLAARDRAIELGQPDDAD